MKTPVHALPTFLVAVSLLFAMGCSHQAISPGRPTPSDELKPGAGVSDSGKLQSSEQPVMEKEGKVRAEEEKEQQAAAPDKGLEKRPRQKSAESDDGIKRITEAAGKKKAASAPAGDGKPSFIPLDKVDIADVEGDDGNVTGIMDKGEGLVLNFDHAPLGEVILALTRMLHLDYMFLAEPKGTVTIHTSGTVSREELFPLFYQILEANGLTAVKDGSIYKIVALKEAPRHLTSGQIKSGKDDPGARQDINIRIIPLKYIDTGEMVKILTPFISAEGSIISHDQSNTLVLVDHPVNIRKALRLIRSFDINLFSGIRHAVFPVKYMASQELASNLQKMLAFYQKRSGQKDLEIIDLEKLNSLLILSESQPLFRKAREFIRELDQPGEESEPHIYIYFIKNSKAKEMAGLLNSIFSESGEEEEVKTEPREDGEEKTGDEAGNPFARETRDKKTTVTMKPPVSDFGSGTLRDEIKITSDEVRNALIIEALPSDYQIVKRVLERLDILPRQVLISVTLAEVQLDDDLDLGVEWSWQHDSDGGGIHNSTWSAQIGGEGLSYTIGQAEKWSAALSALAQKKKVDIISSPSVLASDNKQAQINISTEIPVASAQITYNDDNTDRTQTDIQYRNTGVILNVTPHINENGLVSMEMNQEVSEQSKGVEVGGTTYPSFFKRSINTTLTVNNGQTIVIGGLIRENASDSSSGIPFLSEVPVVGWLFGTVGQGVSKSELIVLIKPTVVANLKDVDAVTSEFAKKVGYEL